METRVRVFNENGLGLFQEFLNGIKFNGKTEGFEKALLGDNNYTEDLPKDVYIEDIDFENKYEFAKYITEKLDLKNEKEMYYHIGLWTWLSAFYFDQVCPLDGAIRKPGQDARHILQEPKDFRTYYRHLLASPARIYADIGDLGRIFLSGKLNTRGDIAEQLQSYQNIGLNKSIIEVADYLYWDKAKNMVKKGAGSKGGGSPRRFAAVVRQFELTYDLNSMTSDAILDLFPAEFKKWAN